MWRHSTGDRGGTSGRGDRGGTADIPVFLQGSISHPGIEDQISFAKAQLTVQIRKKLFNSTRVRWTVVKPPGCLK